MPTETFVRDRAQLVRRRAARELAADPHRLDVLSSQRRARDIRGQHERLGDASQRAQLRLGTRGLEPLLLPIVEAAEQPISPPELDSVARPERRPAQAEMATARFEQPIEILVIGPQLDRAAGTLGLDRTRPELAMVPRSDDQRDHQVVVVAHRARQPGS